MASLLSPPPPSLASNITSVTPGTVGTQNKQSMRKRKSPSEGTQNTIVSSKAAATEMLPGWMDQKATSEVMNKRVKRNSREVNRDNFAENSTKAYRGAKYDTAFKKAALELHNNLSDDQKRGKHKFGARAIANKYNETELTSPNDRKINRETLRHWVGKGNAGKTPPKRGRPTFIPDELPRALATHAVMMQVSGGGEATGKKMVTTGAALLVGTQWEDKICPVNLWRKTRKRNPAILQPVKVKDSEDRRVDWLSFKNINLWTDAAKKLLIEMDMVKNEPGFISTYLFLPFFLRFNAANAILTLHFKTKTSIIYLPIFRRSLVGSVFVPPR